MIGDAVVQACVAAATPAAARCSLIFCYLFNPFDAGYCLCQPEAVMSCLLARSRCRAQRPACRSQFRLVAAGKILRASMIVDV